MKRYSILIPAYNVEKYIVECVESVFSQTGEDSCQNCTIVPVNGYRNS